MLYIYIIKLENNKYYVGKTLYPDFRINDHFNSIGSIWTRKYKPIELLQLIDNCDDYDEDKYVIKCMEEYGINNVRGGSFNQVKLSKENITTINQMLKTYKNQCYICGSNEHFVNDCKNNNNYKPKYELDGKCNCVSSYFLPHRKSKCTLQNTIKYVMEIFDDENDDVDKLKEIDLYKNDKINNNNFIKDSNKLNDDIEKNDFKLGKNLKLYAKCYRCGRKGHYKNECYAKTHVNSNLLK